MKHTCAQCDGDLRYGEDVVQVLQGTNYGAITPAWTKTEAEWHRRCFDGEFDLRSQRPPYKCEKCGKPLAFGEAFRCLVIGKGTDQYSSVAENRGYEIFNVEHTSKCLE